MKRPTRDSYPYKVAPLARTACLCHPSCSEKVGWYGKSRECWPSAFRTSPSDWRGSDMTGASRTPYLCQSVTIFQRPSRTPAKPSPTSGSADDVPGPWRRQLQCRPLSVTIQAALHFVLRLATEALSLSGFADKGDVCAVLGLLVLNRSTTITHPTWAVQFSAFRRTLTFVRHSTSWPGVHGQPRTRRTRGTQPSRITPQLGTR